MKIKNFFHSDTFTLTYVVHDEASMDGVVIDPVLDYDPASGMLGDQSAKNIIAYIDREGIRLRAILETHAHADHLSGSQILKERFPEAIIGIGDGIKMVQEVFKEHFNIFHVKTDASQFDKTFRDFEETSFGTLKMRAIPTPGHTPACMSYLFGDAIFTGDALFMPDYGTGRCDFPKGSAKDLYRSISKNLYSLPVSTRVFVGHDYSPNGREVRFETSIGESREKNLQLNANTTESKFIQFREERDKTLPAPRLLLPSIQINVDAGRLPPCESNGKCYLKIPLKK